MKVMLKSYHTKSCLKKVTDKVMYSVKDVLKIIIKK